MNSTCLVTQTSSRYFFLRIFRDFPSSFWHAVLTVVAPTAGTYPHLPTYLPTSSYGHRDVLITVDVCYNYAEIKFHTLLSDDTQLTHKEPTHVKLRVGTYRHTALCITVPRLIIDRSDFGLVSQINDDSILRVCVRTAYDRLVELAWANRFPRLDLYVY